MSSVYAHTLVIGHFGNTILAIWKGIALPLTLKITPYLKAIRFNKKRGRRG